VIANHHFAIEALACSGSAGTSIKLGRIKQCLGQGLLVLA
jgi:hypothetical protein